MAEDEPRRPVVQQAKKSDSAEDWITTYGDMMTLLMTFFVLLFSMSSIDPVKLEQFGDSVGKALGQKKVAKKRVSLNQIYQEVVKVVEQENLKEQVKVTTDERGVTIALPSAITFGTGSADLNPSIYGILNKVIPMMNQSIFNIAVEGHTDNLPMRSEKYPSNWELSSSRASEVVRYFIRQGVDPTRFRAIGFADTQPSHPGKTIEEANANEQLRSTNRRVEITFLAIS